MAYLALAHLSHAPLRWESVSSKHSVCPQKVSSGELVSLMVVGSAQLQRGMRLSTDRSHSLLTIVHYLRLFTRGDR